MTTVVDELLAVFVPGQPKTKGSLTVRPNGSVHDTPASSKWRRMMADVARREYGRLIAPADGPIAVVAIFYLAAVDVADPAKHVGDIDKLCRNLLDALQDAGVYVDDTQVVRLASEKHPATDLFAPGVWVKVSRCAT